MPDQGQVLAWDYCKVAETDSHYYFINTSTWTPRLHILSKQEHHHYSQTFMLISTATDDAEARAGRTLQWKYAVAFSESKGHIFFYKRTPTEEFLLVHFDANSKNIPTQVICDSKDDVIKTANNILNNASTNEGQETMPDQTEITEVIQDQAPTKKNPENLLVWRSGFLLKPNNPDEPHCFIATSKSGDDPILKAFFFTPNDCTVKVECLDFNYIAAIEAHAKAKLPGGYTKHSVVCTRNTDLSKNIFYFIEVCSADKKNLYTLYTLGHEDTQATHNTTQVFNLLMDAKTAADKHDADTFNQNQSYTFNFNHLSTFGKFSTRKYSSYIENFSYSYRRKKRLDDEPREPDQQQLVQNKETTLKAIQNFRDLIK